MAEKPVADALTDLFYTLEPTGLASGQADNPVLPFIASVVFLSMTLMLALAWWRGGMIRTRAKAFVSAIDRLGGEVGTQASLESWRQVSSRALVDEPWLATQLSEYLEQCWEEDGTLFNAAQAETYFTSSALLPERQTTSEAAPGILTALGILGTFLGITIGLVGLQVGGTSGEMTTAIEGLLQSLGVSFRTSIWGLLFSVAATFRLRNAHSSFEAGRQAFIRWMNDQVVRETPQRLLVKLIAAEQESLEQARLNGQQLSDQLKFLNQSLECQRDQLGELQALGQSMGDAVERAIQQSGIIGAVKDMSESIAKTQADGVQEMLADFTSQLDSQFGENFGGLRDSIETMVGANTSYQTAMGGLVDRLDQSSQTQAEASRHMGQAVVGASGAVERMQLTMAQLNDSADAIQNAAISVGDLLTVQSRTAESQKTMSEKLMETMRAESTGWQEHRAAVAGAYSDIQQEFKSLSVAVRDLVSWHDRVRGSLTTQLEQWNAALVEQRGLTADISKERQGTAQLILGLQESGKGFSAIAERLQGLSGAIQKHFGQLQSVQSSGAQEIQLAAAQLQGVGSTLGESWAQYQSFTKELADSVPNVAALLEGVVEGVRQQRLAVAQGRQLVEELAKTVDAQAKVQSGLEEVGEAVGKTRTALEPAALALTRGTAGLTESSTRLTEVSGQLKGLSTQLEGTGQRLQAAEDGARERWKDVEQSLERTTKDLTAGMRSYSEQVNSSVHGTFADFDGRLADAVGSIEGAIGALQQVAETLEATASDLATGRSS